MSVFSAWFGQAGTQSALPEKMPAIWLITDPSCPEDAARKVADGCEEEGTPLAWDVRQGDAKDLARAACLSSHLETGIGIGPDGTAAIALVSVSEKPYMELAAGDAADAGQLRWLGQAAARISKSQPIPARSAVSIAPQPRPEMPQSAPDDKNPGAGGDAEKTEHAGQEVLARIVTEALLNGILKGGGLK
jgi:hypothetical protein